MTHIPLWPELEGEDARQVWGAPRQVRNVTHPSLTPVLPWANAAGPAAIVVPGGAFHGLSVDAEGYDLARRLCTAGIPAYVLEYRLIPTDPDPDTFRAQVGALLANPANPIELRRLIEEFRPTFRADGRRALRIVRERHDRVAMIGFSAGGILTSDLCVSPDPHLRPDAVACIYTPFLTPAAVPQQAPPLFLLATADDPFGTAGTTELQAAWTRARRPVELHLYGAGGHGFGMNRTGLAVDVWPDLLLRWLATQGFGRTPRAV